MWCVRLQAGIKNTQRVSSFRSKLKSFSAALQQKDLFSNAVARYDAIRCEGFERLSSVQLTAAPLDAEGGRSAAQLLFVNRLNLQNSSAA